jgi:hypothetical protein
MITIIVTIKRTQGNGEVGMCSTTAKEYDSNTPIGQVYKEMADLGNWDISIPLNQIHKVA